VRKRQKGIQRPRPKSATSTQTDVVETVPEPAGLGVEAVWDEEWEKNLLDAAIERVKKKVDAKLYQVFDLYVCKQWPATKVARTLGINRGKIYLAKHRIGGLIKKEVALLRAKPI